MVVAALAGCNQILGIEATNILDGDTRPDLDKDGIVDIDDPCIASQVDDIEDWDRDHIPNGKDSCPSFLQAPADTDGDGVADDCDPHETIPGDRSRCVMRFLNADLNAALWAPRAGAPLEPTAAFLYVAEGQSVLATGPVLPASPSVTIDIIGYVGAIPADAIVRIFLRAGPMPSPTDVACELRATPTQTTVVLTGAVTEAAPAGPTMIPMNYGGFGMQLRMQPTHSGNNVMCLIGYDNTVLWVERHIDFPPGNFGFGVARGDTYLYMIAIYDRDNAQPFPF